MRTAPSRGGSAVCAARACRASAPRLGFCCCPRAAQEGGEEERVARQPHRPPLRPGVTACADAPEQQGGGGRPGERGFAPAADELLALRVPRAARSASAPAPAPRRAEGRGWRRSTRARWHTVREAFGVVEVSRRGAAWRSGGVVVALGKTTRAPRWWVEKRQPQAAFSAKDAHVVRRFVRSASSCSPLTRWPCRHSGGGGSGFSDLRSVALDEDATRVTIGDRRRGRWRPLDPDARWHVSWSSPRTSTPRTTVPPRHGLAVKRKGGPRVLSVSSAARRDILDGLLYATHRCESPLSPRTAAAFCVAWLHPSCAVPPPCARRAHASMLPRRRSPAAAAEQRPQALVRLFARRLRCAGWSRAQAHDAVRRGVGGPRRALVGHTRPNAAHSSDGLSDGLKGRVRGAVVARGRPSEESAGEGARSLHQGGCSASSPAIRTACEAAA